MIIPRGIFGTVVGAILMLAALNLLGWGPAPRGPAYPVVQVDSAAIVQDEPDAEVGIIERVTRPVRRPDVVATAPGAAMGDVRALCSAAGWILPGPLPAPDPEIPTAGVSPDAPKPTPALPRPPSGIPPALRPQMPPVALARSGTVGWHETELWLVRSDGALVRQTHSARPPVSWRLDGDSAIVQGSRFWMLRALAPVALCAGGGWLALEMESALPLAAGCGVGVAIAVR